MRTCITLAMLAWLPLVSATALDLLGPLPTFPQTRIADKDGTTLLSKDGKILAAACVRMPSEGAPVEVLSNQGAQTALANDKLKTEFLRERKFPVGAEPGINLFTQSRAVTQGVRTLVTCSPDKRSNDNANDGPRTLPPLEVAIQIYPDADGNALSLIYVDGEPAADNLDLSQPLRARALSFERAKKQRVTIERSAPATWTIRSEEHTSELQSRGLISY